MVTHIKPEVTDFTRDVLGRYVCNGLDEALRSSDRNARADARPFDIVVIGGGTFGAALAQHLVFRDRARSHRVLLLEAGPFLLPEHVQNLPVLGLNVPTPEHLAALQAGNDPRDPRPRNEVWGLSWHSPTKFTGLAYCIGGRSLYWGGWSPELLPGETPTDAGARSPWPAAVVTELRNPLPDGSRSYFRQASEQIGVTKTNDFIFGPLHEELRQRLLDAITGNVVRDAVPLSELPQHLDDIPAGAEDLYKLEAPLAVQGDSPRAGFFPLSKFSTVPLLIKAARTAYDDSGGDDVKKRFMIVPQCHVRRLVTEAGRVVRVETNQGDVPLPAHGVAVIALGTIESARIALDSFGGAPGVGPIGRNLMAHLRSNLTVRIPRSAFPAQLPPELQASALFVKGRRLHGDGTVGHFHLQITAAGLGAVDGNPEVELFQTVPDIDTFDRFRAASDTHVVVTIRAIGEMEPRNGANFVRLDDERDEWNTRRAFVAITPSANDEDTWNAMDAASDDVAGALAGGIDFQIVGRNRDGLGSTHHEAGTLWMGTDAASSVTDANARFHGIANAYAVGPAVFPTVGSPNPMLTGIALTRRLARHLIPNAQSFVAESGFTALFDGLSLAAWRMAGTGTARVVDGTIELTGGDDLGLFWHTQPTPPDYVLRLEWLRYDDDANSGVFVRFPDPDKRGYKNTAYVGVDFGYEVQIDEFARPDGALIHRTGAVYNESSQTLTPIAARPAGEWNEFEIRVEGQTYTVLLNGTQITRFENTSPARGLPTTPNAPSFLGLQAYPGKRIAFRNIRIQPNAAVAAPPAPPSISGARAPRTPVPELVAAE